LTFIGFYGTLKNEPIILLWSNVLMTIEDYRIRLGWSQAELARRANIDVNTLKRAISGQPVFKHTAGAIATALSQGIGHEITYKDLDGVNVID
jgi:transcriptional regulator with XRE-family HTH domain